MNERGVNEDRGNEIEIEIANQNKMKTVEGKNPTYLLFDLLMPNECPALQQRVRLLSLICLLKGHSQKSQK